MVDTGLNIRLEGFYSGLTGYSANEMPSGSVPKGALLSSKCMTDKSFKTLRLVKARSSG